MRHIDIISALYAELAKFAFFYRCFVIKSLSFVYSSHFVLRSQCLGCNLFLYFGFIPQMKNDLIKQKSYRFSKVHALKIDTDRMIEGKRKSTVNQIESHCVEFHVFKMCVLFMMAPENVVQSLCLLTQTVCVLDTIHMCRRLVT